MMLLMRCALVGEDESTISEVVNTIERRWSDVNETLGERCDKIKALIDVQRLQREADAMARVLESHQKWLQGAESSVENVQDLNRIIDQSKVITTAQL